MRIPVDAVLAFIIISLGIALGILDQNDLFGAYLFSCAAMVCLVPLALIISVIAAVFWTFRPRARRVLRVVTVVAWSLVLAAVVFFYTGVLINRWKVDAVEYYVTKAVATLDGIKVRSGSYPLHLPVDVLGEPPILLKDYGDYKSDGQSFQFEYIDEPAGWAGGEGFLQFDSTNREWREEQ